MISCKHTKSYPNPYNSKNLYHLGVLQEYNNPDLLDIWEQYTVHLSILLVTVTVNPVETLVTIPVQR